MTDAPDDVTGNGTTDAVEGGGPPVAEAPDVRPIVEVVDRPAGAPPAVREEPTALERAADELLATPGAPGRDEFLVLATTARLLSMSRGAPAQVRNDPWLALHMALIGRDLGISPSAAIAQIDVIGEGDDAQLAPSPELINGQVKRLGLGSVVPCRSTPDECIAVALAPGGRIDPRCRRTYPEHVHAFVGGGSDECDGCGEEHRHPVHAMAGGPCSCTHDRIFGDYHFTWAEAIGAGLVDERCTPYEHWAKPNAPAGQEWKRENRCKCRQGYRTYPKRMMWWRAAGYCADDWFPEASIGLYTPEELGAVVDPDTGRMIDPGTVELPEGFEKHVPPPPPSEDVVSEATADTDPGLVAERDAMAARIAAVMAAGEAATNAMGDLWKQTDGEGRRKTPPWGHVDFRRRHLARARAVLTSVERDLSRGSFGEVAAAAWSEASSTEPDADTPAAKSAHDLARERAARAAAPADDATEADEALTAPETPATDDGGGTPDAASEAQDGHEEASTCETCGVPAGGTCLAEVHELADVADAAREQVAATLPLTAPAEDEAPNADDPDRPNCLGCDKPIKTTADGRNHPGPNGRANTPHRSWHRSCAPFD